MEEKKAQNERKRNKKIDFIIYDDEVDIVMAALNDFGDKIFDELYGILTPIGINERVDIIEKIDGLKSRLTDAKENMNDMEA